MKFVDKKISQEEEDWFEDNSVEAMQTMTAILSIQQNVSLELTRLVLTHCSEEKTTKEKVFKLYKEAVDFVRKNIDGK